jgi:hypothetical protein
LVVEGDNAPEPVRPLSILIRMEHGRVPKEITVSHGKKIAVEKVQDLGNGIGRISLKGDNEWRVS